MTLCLCADILCVIALYQTSLQVLYNHMETTVILREIINGYSQRQNSFRKQNKKPAQSVLAAMSLQEQSNQLINDPGVRNTHKGEQVLWESIHHTLFCVTPADVVAREQHNSLSAQMYKCSIEHRHTHNGLTKRQHHYCEIKTLISTGALFVRVCD